VLAGGDGKRLQDYIRIARGEDLPKQYVNFVGRRSMLEHTFDRVERLISARQIVTVVSKQHLRHGAVRDQLSRRAPENVIVQPENKETGPGIFLPLMHLYKRCPDATVAVFPSDHFMLEEDRFMDHVAVAAQAVAHDPSRIVLLAMEAQYPEVEYGYVVPRENHGRLNIWGIRNTARFIEKPDPLTARHLVDTGGLWNTMIMVFKVRTLLTILQRLHPTMHEHFSRIYDAIGTLAETRTIDEVYRTLEPINFSKGFLELVAATSPETISVLPVLQVFWSDWGSPKRLLQVREILANSGHAVTERTVGSRSNQSRPGVEPPLAQRLLLAYRTDSSIDWKTSSESGWSAHSTGRNDHVGRTAHGMAAERSRSRRNCTNSYR
jgi:mannose-1-phosphate guanylyltransferase